MIRNKEEAQAFINKNGIKLSNHKSVIVTGNNSIYLDSEVSSEDESEKFYLKGNEPVEEKEIQEESKEDSEVESLKSKNKKSK